MKEWSLQDIRPNRAPRRTQSRDLEDSRPRERVREELPPRDMQEVSRMSVEEPSFEHDAVSELRDVRPLRGATHARNEPAEFANVGRPLRQKMSLQPSPFGRYVRLAAAGAVVVAAVILYVVHITATAIITVVPRTLDATVESQLSAGDGSSLPYALVTKELEARAPIAAKGIDEVRAAASGAITIYNEFSKDSFALTKNTRFEANGLIFRIQESATVPGYTVAADGTVTAGTVAAKVFADTPGEEGNIAPAQFTVPGLKDDTEQYAKVYAKSTEAFTGGFIGKRAIVEDSVREEVRAQVDAALAEKLMASLQEQAVADQVMYAAGAVITYTDDIETGSGDTEATLVVRGTIKAPIFSARDLAKAVLATRGEKLEGDFTIVDPTVLSFAYTQEVASLAPNAPIQFTLGGQARFVAQLPTQEIATALAGIKVDDLQTIAVKYPGADRITYRMTPAWRSSFPTDPNRITIEFAVLE
ncbi:hypothetical protein A3C89_01425 [Candidatus Kaiserbacteria bacterium RIFCSPHIGHO2_02_FULL_50_50]|uniref:Baseplate protein J-like domain-containing protein n=1 Tax=Candidatus Kaiserbacteria bacterium RIFCSPHIGHO2_02_FULL_50_50 TaxID=1798492 RepID=A0A1F6DCF8_9BACT|nr:MAG: hypothetical protein A3C89_01425 [Candidatus Kaiserbacteria bacterium RIFCSPHIGHO2_02_FULL_50_50]OGG89303.1 MAG: hypothetical protein A3G62_01500 [Candidatus Kaiserbacteria bacterium RIFCSPLOWO2_12_FULL_50_10]